ncbi:MAG: type II toxin-antitoxin system RelE/ParE family toxin [Hormoscilla sp. GUM202]|nr:type II toxin-antitoxin system RelE/ParE family toxin [Hormoscilla sp. GUM202]
MTYNILIQPEAELDLIEAYNWYEERSQGLGDEFITAVDICLSLIQRNPLSYPVVAVSPGNDKSTKGETQDEQFHRALVRRFPYEIFYRISDETIVVLACFHGRRNPQWWQNRIGKN